MSGKTTMAQQQYDLSHQLGILLNSGIVVQEVSPLTNTLENKTRKGHSFGDFSSVQTRS